MKCNLCGTENEHIRMLFTSVDCTNVECTNYHPDADRDKDNGAKEDVVEGEDAVTDWLDIWDFSQFH